jgi:hypothetical protein
MNDPKHWGDSTPPDLQEILEWVAVLAVMAILMGAVWLIAKVLV